MWHRRYRMLIGIYAIAVVVGAREYLVSRGQEPVDFLSEKWSDLTDVVSAINPGDPDTEFLEAVQALQQGDEETFLEHLEEALSADVKHNDLLLQSYAQHLLNTGTDHARVNAALNRWRENHPFSVETVWLPLASGPRNAADLADLNRALGEVPTCPPTAARVAGVVPTLPRPNELVETMASHDLFESCFARPAKATPRRTASGSGCSTGSHPRRTHP